MQHRADAMSGLIAAHLAAAAGKVQRGHALDEKEAKLAKRASNAAYNLQAVLTASISYWEYSVRESSHERLFDAAWRQGKLGDGPATLLEQVGLQLRRFSEGELLNAEELTFLHDFFAELADLVNATFTSSGEGIERWYGRDVYRSVHA